MWVLALDKFRWHIRYPAAILAGWTGGHLFMVEHVYVLSAICAVCAAILAKEISPSLLLLAGSIWICPDDLWHTPLAQFTLAMIVEAFASLLMLVAAPVVALALYVWRDRAR